MSFIAKLSCPPDNLQRLCDLNGKQYSSISVIFQYLARVPLALLNVMSGLPGKPDRNSMSFVPDKSIKGISLLGKKTVVLIGAPSYAYSSKLNLFNPAYAEYFPLAWFLVDCPGIEIKGALAHVYVSGINFTPLGIPRSTAGIQNPYSPTFCNSISDNGKYFRLYTKTGGCHSLIKTSQQFFFEGRRQSSRQFSPRIYGKCSKGTVTGGTQLLQGKHDHKAIRQPQSRDRCQSVFNNLKSFSSIVFKLKSYFRKSRSVLIKLAFSYTKVSPEFSQGLMGIFPDRLYNTEQTGDSRRVHLSRSQHFTSRIKSGFRHTRSSTYFSLSCGSATITASIFSMRVHSSVEKCLAKYGESSPHSCGI